MGTLREDTMNTDISNPLRRQVRLGRAAAVMVQTLIDCRDKDKRFSLIEFIPATGKAVVPICEYCLKQDPPWYVIRNLIIIISRIGDRTAQHLAPLVINDSALLVDDIVIF